MGALASFRLGYGHNGDGRRTAGWADNWGVTAAVPRGAQRPSCLLVKLYGRPSIVGVAGGGHGGGRKKEGARRGGSGAGDQTLGAGWCVCVCVFAASGARRAIRLNKRCASGRRRAVPSGGRVE